MKSTGELGQESTAAGSSKAEAVVTWDRLGVLLCEPGTLISHLNLLHADGLSPSLYDFGLKDGVDGQSLLGDHRSEYSVASSRRSRPHEAAVVRSCFFWLVAARRKEVQEHGQKEWAVARNVQPRMDVESQDFL